MEEHAARVEGGTVRYRVGGAGEPLVLVHGLAGSRRWWSANLDALASRFRVHAVDLPRGTPLADAPDRLKSWLDAVGIECAHLVGHSLGGLVCARLAAAAPDRVRRLVLVAPVGVRTDRTLLAHVPALAASTLRVSPAFLRLLAADALRLGPHRVLRAARDLLAHDVTEELRRVEAPTLLVWGERDVLVPVASCDVWRQEIADARLVSMPHVGHVPMVERPREFVELVLDFLAEDGKQS